MRFSRRGVLTALALLALGLILTLTGTVCPFRELTGIPCPGCGMTRALRCLLRLDFVTAWRWNPLCFLLPFLLWEIAADGKPFRSRRANGAALIVLLALTAGGYAAKLIRFFATGDWA